MPVSVMCLFALYFFLSKRKTRAQWLNGPSPWVRLEKSCRRSRACPEARGSQADSPVVCFPCWSLEQRTVTLKFATTACLEWDVWPRQLNPSSYRILTSVCFCFCERGCVCCVLIHVLKHKHDTHFFLSEVFSRDYPMMLSVFSNLLTKESDLRVIDNLCAALCRMIMSNVGAVPLEQVYICTAPTDP